MEDLNAIFTHTYSLVHKIAHVWGSVLSCTMSDTTVVFLIVMNAFTIYRLTSGFQK